MTSELPLRVAQIVEALEAIGSGTPSQILEAIRLQNLGAPALTTVRARLQEHSSDSSQFKGKRDLFYSVEGIGRGVWGLRDTDPLSPNNLDGYLDEAELNQSDIEGKLILRAHLRRERSARIVRMFKRSLRNASCSVCDFDFGSTYGDELAKDYIEAHHVVPLGTTEGPRLTTVQDLVGVCANCHRVLHLNPHLSHFELRAIVQRRINT